MIRNVPFFIGMEEQCINAIISRLVTRHCMEGDVIVREGDFGYEARCLVPRLVRLRWGGVWMVARGSLTHVRGVAWRVCSSHMFVLRRGVISVTKEETIRHYLTRGGFFGEICLVYVLPCARAPHTCAFEPSGNPCVSLSATPACRSNDARPPWSRSRRASSPPCIGAITTMYVCSFHASARRPPTPRSPHAHPLPLSALDTAQIVAMFPAFHTVLEKVASAHLRLDMQKEVASRSSAAMLPDVQSKKPAAVQATLARLQEEAERRKEEARAKDRADDGRVFVDMLAQAAPGGSELGSVRPRRGSVTLSVPSTRASAVEPEPRKSFGATPRDAIDSTPARCRPAAELIGDGASPETGASGLNDSTRSAQSAASTGAGTARSDERRSSAAGISPPPATTLGASRADGTVPLMQQLTAAFEPRSDSVESRMVVERATCSQRLLIDEDLLTSRGSVGSYVEPPPPPRVMATGRRWLTPHSLRCCVPQGPRARVRPKLHPRQ